ncbi:2495_t:CDS:2, partial [Ambispora leptoticha]
QKLSTRHDYTDFYFLRRRNILSADLLAKNVQLAKIINVYVGLFSKETWQFLLKNGISRPRTTRPPTTLRESQPNLVFNNLKELRITGIKNEKMLQEFLENFTEVCHSIRGITLNKDSMDDFNKKTIEILDENKSKNATISQKELEWLEL